MKRADRLAAFTQGTLGVSEMSRPDVEAAARASEAKFTAALMQKAELDKLLSDQMKERAKALGAFDTPLRSPLDE